MAETKQKGIHYAWVIMVGCFLLQAGQLGIIMNTAGVFLQPVADSIGCGRGDLSLYMTIMGWCTAFTMPIAGRWISTKNFNVLMVVVSVLAGGSFIAMSFFTQVWMWWIAAVVLGFSTAFTFFAAIPIVIQNWFAKKTGFAMGIATCSSGLGAAVFSPILTNLCVSMGWQSTYVVAGVVSLILSVPVCAFVLKLKPADKGMLPYGAEEGADAASVAKAADATGISASRAWKSGLVVVIFFIGASISLTCSFGQHLAGFGTSMGLDATLTGLVLSMYQLGNLVAKIGMGTLNDAIGIKKTFLVSTAIPLVGVILMIVSGGNTFMLLAGSLLYGFVNGNQTVLAPIICRKMFGSKDYAKMWSYSTMGNSILGALGVSINGMLYDVSGTYLTPLTIVIVGSLVISTILVLFGLYYSKKVGFDKEDVPAAQPAQA